MIIKIAFPTTIIALLFLAACAPAASTPAPGAIDTAIAQTQAAQPTSTHTPVPTSTATPLPTETPTSTPDPCPKADARIYDGKMLDKVKEFTEAAKLIAVDVRSTQLLAQTQMLSIKQEVMLLVPPECGKGVHSAAIALMDSYLDAFDSITEDKSDKQEKLAEMVNAAELFGQALDDFRKEAGIETVAP